MKIMILSRTIFGLIISLLFISSSFANISTPTVGVTLDEANHYAQYTITSATRNNDLRVGVPDSIIVVFNANTVVPSTISPSLVTINTFTSGGVSVSGQRVAIATPIDIDKNVAFVVVFDSSAKIRNPESTGSYTLQAATSRTADQTLVTSITYSIVASNSAVSAAGVTPNPSVEDENASYSIAFNTGAGGYLNASEGTITIDFDARISVPEGSISGVTVNGTGASATGSSNAVQITTPVDIDNKSGVEVVFAIGAGLVNGAAATDYEVEVRTSSEPNDVTSDQFTISDDQELSISAITTKPDTVNQTGEFAFEFRTGSSGALVAADSDEIHVVFQQNTYLPSTLSASAVLVSSGGFSDNAAAVSVSETATEVTVDITVPFDIGDASDVSITFTTSAGYLNPSVAGNYILKLSTDAEPTQVSSNPYAVASTTTTVSQAIVTPDDTTPTSFSGYTVDFNLGSLGRLKSGTSTITVTFPTGYTLDATPVNYNNTSITVAGGTPTILTPSSISGLVIEFTLPSSVETNNGDNIVLYINSTDVDVIQNPSSGSYSVDVKTSVESTDVGSAEYAIGGTSITLHSVSLTNSAVNNVSQYTFDMSVSGPTANLRAQDDDYVKVIFPEGTVMPSSINGSDVTIDGRSADRVTVDQGTHTAIAYVSNGPAIGGRFDVIFTTSANITNPIVPSTTFYKVTMNTSKDISPVTSSAYPITSGTGTVSGISATANPSFTGSDPAAYTVNFTTSALGKLAGGTAAGSSTIIIEFHGTGTSVPSSISASTVQVNSNVCQTVEVVDTTVTVYMPNGLTIDNNTAVTVNFSTDAGLSNGSANSYDIYVHTSSDDGAPPSFGSYTITSTQDLSVSSVIPNPTTQNANAGYTITFTTGTSVGAPLTEGEAINIAFPTNTYLPGTSLNVSDVQLRVNGGDYENPTSNPTITGNTLTILVPAALAPIAAVSEITVLVNQTGGILNPTLVGGYTLDVSTTDDPAGTSPTYNITLTSTTLSVADVSVADNSLSAYSQYTIDFSVGTNGRMIAQTSTITVTFNASTGVNNNPINYDACSITVDGGTTPITPADISVSGQSVIFTIPTDVSVDNNDDISLVINDGTTPPIQNPSSAGSYTLDVKTSVETSDVTSNSYTISNAPPVSGVTVSFTESDGDTVNISTGYIVSFTVDGTSGQLDLGVGTITITFPNNTFVPSGIDAGDISVNTVTAITASSNPSNRSITITTPTQIDNGEAVTVNIATALGIQNPSLYGPYNLNVRTSSQPNDATSADYTLLATETMISGVSIDITPNIPNEIGRYVYQFTTGSKGRLVSGTSTITLLIPGITAGFAITPVSPSKVTVNSAQADAITLNAGNPDEVIITIPSSVTIGNNSDVTVIIDETAELVNDESVASLRYFVYTSVQTKMGYTDHSLPVELTSFKAESVDGNVALNWRTESETNNAYWIMERKEVSEQEFEQINKGTLRISETNYPFEAVARIEGRGNTATRSDYLYIDSLVTVGSIYAYRLADVSFTGEISYHDVVFKKVEAPAKFTLTQNYPNPFNPETTVKYSLPATADVELKIFNILGQEIKTLVKGVIKAGFYDVKWDGRNELNHQVASGVYIYSIQARSLKGNQKFVRVRKMVLIR